jgi:hypothetical protein
MLKTYAAALSALLLVNLSLCRADEDSPPPANTPSECCSNIDPCAAPALCGCRRGLFGRIRDRFHRPPVCCSTEGACQTCPCEPCSCQPRCRRTLLEKLHLRHPSECTCCCQGVAMAEPAPPAQESPEAPAEDEKEPERMPSQPVPRTRARLSAAPNPVPVTSGQGSATLNWTTGDGSVGQMASRRSS